MTKDISEKGNIDNQDLGNQDNEKNTTTNASSTGEEEQNQVVENDLNTEKIIDLENKLARCIAEVENTRNRFSKQLEESAKYGISDFVKQLVVVFENFFRVIENAPHDDIKANPAFENFFEGITLTHSDLVKTLESNGIKRIHPLNEIFDHHFHQVISSIESDQPPGTVLKVIQSGYSLNGRILKEALVVTAKAK